MDYFRLLISGWLLVKPNLYIRRSGSFAAFSSLTQLCWKSLKHCHTTCKFPPCSKVSSSENLITDFTSLWSQQKLWGLTETKDIETWEKVYGLLTQKRFEFIAKFAKYVHKKTSRSLWMWGVVSNPMIPLVKVRPVNLYWNGEGEGWTRWDISPFLFLRTATVGYEGGVGGPWGSPRPAQ